MNYDYYFNVQTAPFCDKTEKLYLPYPSLASTVWSMAHMNVR